MFIRLQWFHFKLSQSPIHIGQSYLNYKHLGRPKNEHTMDTHYISRVVHGDQTFFLLRFKTDLCLLNGFKPVWIRFKTDFD